MQTNETRNAAGTPATLSVADIIPAAVNVHAAEDTGSADFRGLADSIRALGIIHRIVVRPADGGKFRIVDGHRRFAAAKAAGLAEVPVEVIHADDSKATTLTLTANIQRLENDPLLESDHFTALAKGGETIEDIALRVGKSQSYVAVRLRMGSLVPEWREFFKTHPSTLELMENVARHEPALQKAVAEDCELAGYAQPGDYYDGKYPWEEFENVFKRMVLDLTTAPFDTAECRECPNNTANHGLLFPVEDEDGNKCAKCENRQCYVRRANLAADAIIARLYRAGRPAIEVADKWRIPCYWDTTSKADAKHPQGYVYTDGDIRAVVFGQPNAKVAAPARSSEEIAAEKAAKKAARERRAHRSDACAKIRTAVERLAENEDTMNIVVNSISSSRAAAEFYARRIRGILTSSWMGEGDCEELLAVCGNAENLKLLLDGAELTEDEAKALAPEIPETEGKESK